RPANAARVRVMPGTCGGVTGSAQTFSPVSLFDLRLGAGRRVALDLKDGDTAALYVLGGEVVLNDDESARETELVVLDRRGAGLTLEARSDATVFVMSGTPIEEPIAGYGPFVMNTHQEIQQAFVDFHRGRLGVVTHETEKGSA